MAAVVRLLKANNRAVEWTNNRAVELLMLGKDRKAYRLLQYGAKVTPLVNSSCQPNSGDRVNVVPIKLQDIPEAALTSIVVLMPFYVHISPGMEDDFEEFLQEHMATTAVLLYNMAIVCHQYFFRMRSPTHRDRALKQAQQLYLQAVGILQQLRLEGSMGQVTLSACINLLEIAHEVGDVDQVHRWHSRIKAACRSSTIHAYDAYLAHQAYRIAIYYSVNMISARAA